ncbi:tetratricopeptide repeat protein [Phaeospirillum tilakii]|uniref:Tetratricopeptide repeat protein n=1 Tax=Phaeospirillum tilakii TaxID=741673 RepID=A0ABW5C7V0_9PROT
MSSDSDWAEALGRFQAGDFAAAERACHAVLAQDAFHRNALNLLAVLCCQAGRLEQGITHCRAVLALDPDDSQALQTLGDALHLTCDFAGAAAAFARAVAVRGRHWPLCAKLAAALLRAGRRPEAIAAYHEALAAGAPERVRQDCAVAEFEWGLELYHQGRRDDAILAYRAALTRKPDLALAHCNLGAALQENGELDAAIACYQTALAHAPAYPDALSNLGVARQEQGRLDEAAAQFEAALRIQPDHPLALNNLGKLRQEQGRRDEARALYREAARLAPDHPDSHFNLALLDLQAGAWETGWAGYEWRWRRPGAQRHDFGLPEWDGTPLAGRTLLLWCEQGLGDSIQFVRFAARIVSGGGRVVLLCPPELEALLQGVTGIDRVVSRISTLPPCDCQAPLLSLPRLLGTRLATLPAPVPYLAVPPAATARWRDRLAALPGRKVGLVWRGRPQHTNDRNRSLDPARLAPLLDRPGISFVSLQKGARPDDAAALAGRAPLLDLGPELADFTDTAAVLAGLDLVISVDTSVIHLAGALGRPGWLLLPFDPDWRWLLERQDSPWYPTLRLFRQPAPGAWDPVIADLADALGGFP